MLIRAAQLPMQGIQRWEAEEAMGSGQELSSTGEEGRGLEVQLIRVEFSRDATLILADLTVGYVSIYCYLSND